jgi:UDP-N-acetyl-D-mannosaminuronate dehydrogenase
MQVTKSPTTEKVEGYVGLPLAMRAVLQAGYQVVGLEADERRAKKLCVGESYVEDISDETIVSAMNSGCYLTSSAPTW